jgi:hypothetical protein
MLKQVLLNLKDGVPLNLKIKISAVQCLKKVLYQTGRVCTIRPAKKNKRSVKRKRNSNANVMYIHTCVHVCRVALLCCLLVH